MIHLPHTLAGLADICADESARYSMAGVHVTGHGHYYELVATDGKRLLLVQGLNDPRCPYSEILETADDSETSAVIRRRRRIDKYGDNLSNLRVFLVGDGDGLRALGQQVRGDPLPRQSQLTNRAFPLAAFLSRGSAEPAVEAKLSAVG